MRSLALVSAGFGDQDSKSDGIQMSCKTPGNGLYSANLRRGYNCSRPIGSRTFRNDRGRFGSFKTAPERWGELLAAFLGMSGNGSTGSLRLRNLDRNDRSRAFGSVRERSGAFGSVQERLGALARERSGALGIVRERSGSFGIVRDRSGSFGMVRDGSGPGDPKDDF